MTDLMTQTGAAPFLPDGPILLCSPSGAGGGAVLELLAVHLEQVTQVEPAAADKALEDRPEAGLVLFFRAAAGALSRAMEAGTAPGAAAEDWKTAAAALQRLVQRHRHRVRLFDLDGVARFPQAFAARLGLPEADATALADDLAKRFAPPEAGDPLLDMLARQVVQQDLGLQMLAGDLEANAIDLSGGEDPAGADPAAAFKRYRAAIAEEETAALSDEQQQELTILREQQQQAQAELAGLYAETTRLRSELAEGGPKAGEIAALEKDLKAQYSKTGELDARIKQRDGTIAELEARLKERDREAEELERNLERSETQTATLDGQLRQQRAELGDLRVRESELSAALSDARSAEARATARQGELEDALAERDSQLETARTEQVALMQQLQQVQTEVETQYDLRRDLSARLDAAEQEKQNLVNNVRALQKEKARLERARAELAEEKRKVDAWVHGIMASKSYRIMEPLRKLRAMMLKRG